MNRSLRVSPRPFVGLAIVLSPVVLIWLFVLVRKGFRSEDLLAGVLLFLLYSAVMTAICSIRVSVSQEGITVRSYFVLRRFIPFAAIDHSEVQILAERDHPVCIDVCYRDGEKDRRLGMSLKAYRKDDVAWFCALPEIRAHIHPGFTKKA